MKSQNITTGEANINGAEVKPVWTGATITGEVNKTEVKMQI